MQNSEEDRAVGSPWSEGQSVGFSIPQGLSFTLTFLQIREVRQLMFLMFHCLLLATFTENARHHAKCFVYTHYVTQPVQQVPYEVGVIIIPFHKSES